ELEVVSCVRGIVALVWSNRRGEHQAGLALLKHVAGTVARARFGPAIGHQVEAEGRPIIYGRLLRISHKELDVVRSIDRKRILHRIRVRYGLRGHCHSPLKVQGARRAWPVHPGIYDRSAYSSG